MKVKRKQKGFALGMALVLGLAILIMGLAGGIMSEMGFRSLSAEARWHMVEKAANYGLTDTIHLLYTNSTTCAQLSSNGRNLNVNNVSVFITAKEAGNSCFLWSKATLRNSTHIKTAVVTYESKSSLLAPLIVKKFNSFSLGGAAAIVNCEQNCTTPAIITGYIPGNPTGQVISACPNNPGGIMTFNNLVIDSNTEYLNVDFTERLFHAGNRIELLSKLSLEFKVELQNGKPVRISGTYTNINNIPNGSFDVCELTSVNECSASGSTITCSDYTATWNSTIGKYRVKRSGSNNEANCTAIDFGQNTKLNFNSNFTGGGTIMANEINLKDDVTGIGIKGITLIARNKAEDQANNIKLQNVNLFAQNIDINDNGLEWEGGIIYSGGAGTGNLNINIQSNTRIGKPISPVLIIVDNNINIQGNGNAEIHGLVFATDENNNFNTANGDFKLYGALVSNSLKNNTYNANGNFDLYFSSDILKKLASKFSSIVKLPACSGGKGGFVRAMLTQSKMGTY